MSELIDPGNVRQSVQQETEQAFGEPFYDPSFEIEKNIEAEIKEATGLTALEEEQAKLEAESKAQRQEFQRLLEEAQAAPTEASRAAALARRRRRAGATRASTRVARGQTATGETSRTTLGGA